MSLNMVGKKEASMRKSGRRALYAKKGKNKDLRTETTLKWLRKRKNTSFVGHWSNEMRSTR